MSAEIALPGRVTFQFWEGNKAVDVDERPYLPMEFDAHKQMHELSPTRFSVISKQILHSKGHHHDYDELAFGVDEVNNWLAADKENTIFVEIDEDDFRQWLQAVGLSDE
jgi:hypothetical protein